MIIAPPPHFPTSSLFDHLQRSLLQREHPGGVPNMVCVSSLGLPSSLWGRHWKLFYRQDKLRLRSYSAQGQTLVSIGTGIETQILFSRQDFQARPLGKAGTRRLEW